jgi:hypothetical protein
MQRNDLNGGFTLVELFTTIAVLAACMVVLLPPLPAVPNASEPALAFPSVRIISPQAALAEPVDATVAMVTGAFAPPKTPAAPGAPSAPSLAALHLSTLLLAIPPEITPPRATLIDITKDNLSSVTTEPHPPATL